MKKSALKIQTILILLVASFSLGSCSSDDDTVKDIATKDLLLGKWLITKSSGQPVLSDCEKTSYITYRSDGIAESILFTETTDKECVPFLGGTLDYELLSDKEIKFTDHIEGDSFICEILSISATTMTLKGFLDEDVIFDFKKQ